MAEHNDFGKLAEAQAAEYLENNGCKILAKNYRYLKAEIDLICETHDQILFVEVKARATDVFMEPQEAVNKKKIRLLVSAADQFLQQNNLEKEARFDIISVLPDSTGALQITHIPDAFLSTDAN